jgi:hypothetical protein
MYASEWECTRANVDRVFAGIAICVFVIVVVGVVDAE